MQNYRLLFTENNTNDRYLILAIYQSGREGIKMVLEHYKNTYPDLNYTICRMDNDCMKGENA